jgi:Flp pilus assembly protein TadG
VFNKYVYEFIREERGGGTVMGLMWFMLLVGICGLAVDSTDGFRNKTMMQATADASALSGAIDLPNVAAAKATAVSYSVDNMHDTKFGEVLKAQDVEIGTWDEVNRSFSLGGALPDAVRVRLHQTNANSNAVATNFLRIAGIQSFEVNVVAVAQRFIPKCLRDGLTARGVVNISSNNDFVNEICIHGQQGVEMQNQNDHETGVIVSMPPGVQLTIPTGGMESNPGLPEALRENILDPRDVNHVDEMMAAMIDPTSPLIPSYIDTAEPVIVVDDKFDLSTVQPHRIYYVDCKANKTASIPSNVTISKVVIIADCEITVGSGAVLFDVVLGSRSGGSKKIENANIGFSANVMLGLPDNCNPGGGVTLLSNASIHTSSSMVINGVQMIAAGDIDLGSSALGINGISAQAGGDINMSSNNAFGLCSGGAPQVSSVGYYRLVK